MADGKTKITLVNNYPAAEHTCPASGNRLRFFGRCPNISCPANISQWQDSASGCFMHSGKPTEVDVGRHLHITTKEVKQLYQRGMSRATNFLQFYYWLLDQRDQTKRVVCQHCGVILSNAKQPQCLNGLRCARRQKIWQRISRRYPFNLPALNIQPNEFWQAVIAQRQEKIHVIPRRYMERAGRALALIVAGDNNHADTRPHRPSPPRGYSSRGIPQRVGNKQFLQRSGNVTRNNNL